MNVPYIKIPHAFHWHTEPPGRGLGAIDYPFPVVGATRLGVYFALKVHSSGIFLRKTTRFHEWGLK